MKRLTVLCLSLLLALSLCACGGDTPAEETTDPATESATTETTPESAPETSPETKPASENRYTCTSIVIGEKNLDGEGQWLELEPDGTAVLFIADSEHMGTYTLTDGALTIDLEDLNTATGTLAGDVITLELIGMTFTFEK